MCSKFTVKDKRNRKVTKLEKKIVCGQLKYTALVVRDSSQHINYQSTITSDQPPVL